MSNTRQKIRDLCRRRLGDLAVPYRWSDLQINQWINDATGDYSVHFPRLAMDSFTTTPGQNRYPLAAEQGRRVLSVEYPVSPSAPDRQNLLQPGELNDPGFFVQDGFYAVEYTPDSAGEIVLWLSGAPSGANCRLTCHCDHPSLDDDSDVTSLPERHLELVMLYVRWASYQELASAESSNPDPTSLALSTLELNAFRAQRLYLTSLNECKQAESESRMIRWKLDRWDRVY